MKWTDRKFEFDFPANSYTDFVKRLQSTPSRLETLVSEVTAEILIKKPDQKWSIQENVGHLLTVESLFAGRLDDYAAGAAELRPAKVDGSRTDLADYNSWHIEKVLADFRINRLAYLNRLNGFPADFFEKQAWHPRLAMPMRVCDMLFFQAEHDDYHLSKITDIKIMFSVSG